MCIRVQATCRQVEAAFKESKAIFESCLNSGMQNRKAVPLKFPFFLWLARKRIVLEPVFAQSEKIRRLLPFFLPDLR